MTSPTPTVARASRFPRWEVAVVCVWFAVLTTLAELFPRSGDDWAWGSHEGIERLRIFFRGINGRYGGDLLIIGLTRAGWLAGLVVSFTICASLVLVLELADQRTPLGYGLASAAFLAMPLGVWRQSVVWLSGFVNYVVAALFLFVFLAVAARDWADGHRTTHTGPLLAAAVAGFVGQLFMEHVTLAICVLGFVMTLLMRAVHRCWPRYTLTWTVAAFVGAAVMFSNSAYRRAASGGSGYQSVQSGSLKAYGIRLLDDLPNQAVVANVLLNGLLAGALLALVAINRGRADRPAGDTGPWATWALRLVPACAIAFLALSWGLRLAEHRAHLREATRSLATLAALLLAVSVVLAAMGLVRSGRRRFTMLAGIASVALMLGPLLVVNPIGPRCFYPTYLALLLVAVTLFGELADRVGALNRLYVTLPVQAVGAALAVMLLVIYATIRQGAEERLDKVRAAARNHQAVVTLTPLPHSNWVHDANPFWSLLAQRYKTYYGISSPIVVKVSPNPWLRTPTNRHPVSPP